MSRDEIVAQLTILIDRAYESGFSDGYSGGLSDGLESVN